MAESQFTLFGQPSPEEVRQRIGRTAAEDALSLASVPRGRMGVAVAGLLGPAIKQAFGQKDPQVQLAEKRSEAMRNAYDRSSGSSIDYYRYLADNLNAVDDPQGAMQALEQYRQLAAGKAATQFAARKLDIEEKKLSEKTRLQSEKLALQGEQLDLKAELGRKESEIKRLTAESSSNLNSAKVKKLQADIEALDTKMAQQAEALRQKDDQIEILRHAQATREFDAQTRRMKLKSDERIAQLRNSNVSGKAAQKILGTALDGYEKATLKKNFVDFAKELVKDNPELGSFFADVDKETMSQLIRGEVLQAIGDARVRGDTGFNYNQAVEQSVLRAAQKYTAKGENPVGIERTQLTFPRADQNLSDEDLMNQLLQGQ